MSWRSWTCCCCIDGRVTLSWLHHDCHHCCPAQKRSNCRRPCSNRGTDAEVALTVCRLKQGVPAIWHNSSGQQRKLCALFMYDTREYDAQFLRAHARDSVARNVLEKPSAAEMHVACWCSPARVTTLFMPQVPCRRKRCTVLENDIFYCGLVVQTATELVLVWMT